MNTSSKQPALSEREMQKLANILDQIEAGCCGGGGCGGACGGKCGGPGSGGCGGACRCGH